MSARIVEFTRDKVRQRDTLPPTRRAYFFQQFRAVADDLRQCGTGEKLTDAERDKFACDLLARIEEARERLHGKK